MLGLEVQMVEAQTTATTDIGKAVREKRENSLYGFVIELSSCSHTVLYDEWEVLKETVESDKRSR